MTRLREGLAVLGLAALVAGCPPPPPCVPGQSIACAGPAGCAGHQVCSADGAAYLPCDCGADAGMVDAGTVDSGTADAGDAWDGGRICAQVPANFVGVFHLDPPYTDSTGLPRANNVQFFDDGTFLASVQGCNYTGYKGGTWKQERDDVRTSNGTILSSDGGMLWVGPALTGGLIASEFSTWQRGGLCFSGGCDAGTLVDCTPEGFSSDGGGRTCP